jgi:amidase
MKSKVFQSASQLLRALRRRRVTSRELLETCLERVERVNPALNAVVTLDAERARAAADAADRALAEGAPLGPLHGLPVTVKDTYETAGVRTTCGVPELADHVSKTDAVSVARLRAAGAVIFGKTNTPTWAGDWQTTNPVFGTTHNPWDATRTPGGSSGGSAAAIAAGLSALELGSDIGGSIRVPAHCCGVFGHKPSHGLVPQRGHIPGPPGTLTEYDLNCVGPIARSAEDLALALGVLAGPLPEHAHTVSFRLPRPRARRLDGFRVAAWLDEPACPVDTEMRDLLETAAAGLERAGAKIDRHARPEVDFREAVETYLTLLAPIMSLTFPEALAEQMIEAGDQVPAEAPGLLAASARAYAARHRDWLRAHERREAMRARWAAFFGDFDVLLCPVMLVPAFPLDESEFTSRTLLVNGEARPYLENIQWPGLVTMALLPSTVIPVGRTRGGVPVGVQIVGPYLEDATTLAFARAAERELGGFTPPEGLAE